MAIGISRGGQHMVKGKISGKFLAVIAGATALAVAVTLLFCILTTEATCAPGFSYDDFAMFTVGSTSYLASPDGNVYALGNMGTTTAYLTAVSMDRSTMVYPQSNGTFVVISPQGARVLEQQVVYPTSSTWPTTVSFYGDAVYLFAQDDENPGYAALWRYDVKNDSAIRLGNFLGGVTECVVSPNGDSFAMMDERHDIYIFTCKNEAFELQTWPVENETKLYFLTDNGVLFFGEATGGLQSFQNKEIIYNFPDTQTENLKNVLFNQDATEMIVNLETGGCYLYTLKAGVVQDSVQLKQEGNLELFTDPATLFPVGSGNAIRQILGVQHAVVDVESFRQLNLRDAESAERVKLTKDNRLIYQENSAVMNGELAPGGKYILYQDAAGDYFYTDTDDEKGTFHVLWEASACDVFYTAAKTGHKSFYYGDLKGNFHYTKLGKDTVLWAKEQWDNVSQYVFDYATDTVYAVMGDTLYCSQAGERPHKIATISELFPGYMNPLTLFSDTSAGVYCYATNAATDEPVFYRLYEDGSYRLIE